MTSDLETVLRPVVRQPELWFGCASELSTLLPELGDRLGEALDGFLANPARHAPGLMGLARAFYLLAGYAAENYLKGLWLVKHHADPGTLPDPDAPFLPRGLDSHALSDCAAQAEVRLDDDERAILDFLERAVTWYARYPVPKRPARFELFGVQRGQTIGVLALLEKLRQCAGLPLAPDPTIVLLPVRARRQRPKPKTPRS